MSRTVGRLPYTSICRWLVTAAYVLFLASFVYRPGQARPSGTDRGLLFLSGATYMVRGETNPLTQRSPLYSILLAGFGSVMGAADAPTQDLAREFGSPSRSPVSTAFVQPPFLRLVLWLNIGFYAGIVVLMASMMKSLGVPTSARLAALAMHLVISTGTPIDYVHELVFTQFLIAAACWFLAKSLQTGGPATAMTLAGGLCAALAGLSRPTYQVLGLALAMCFAALGVLLGQRRDYLKRALLVVLPSVVLIGSVSARNAATHGFFGVSSVLGTTMGAKTALFVERSEVSFPDLAPTFVEIRNQTLVSSAEHTAALWAGGAANFLMRERGMTFVQANQFMRRVNLDLIRRAPLRYLSGVATAIVQHLWSNTSDMPAVIRLPLSVAELSIIWLFVLSMAVWASFHLLLRSAIVSSPAGQWSPLDSVIAVLGGTFACSVLVTCAMEAGRPEHRVPVQFLMPLLLVFVSYRLWSCRARH